MGALYDLYHSEKGILAVVLLVGATVLAGVGQLDAAAWRSFTFDVFAVYAGTKAVTTVGVALAKRGTPPET